MSVELDLELLRRLHPPVGSPSEDARHRARARLAREIDATRGPRGRGWRARLGVRSSLGLAGALAVVLAALILAATLRGGAARPASAAAAVLQRAALQAQASGGPRELRPGEYWYVQSIDTTAGVLLSGPDDNRPRQIIDALGTVERQVWLGVDKPGLIVEHVVGPIRFLSVGARAQWIRDGRPAELDPVSRIALPADAFDLPYKRLVALPTNVNALQTEIKRLAGAGSRAWKRHEMLTVIGDLLREDPVPAAVRAALYRVAAGIPGIRVLGLTHDAVGRPALAIGLDDSFDGLRDELLFDPRTAKLLGESYVAEKPPPAYHVKPGTVRSGSTYLSSGIVERIGERPRG